MGARPPDTCPLRTALSRGAGPRIPVFGGQLYLMVRTPGEGYIQDSQLDNYPSRFRGTAGMGCPSRSMWITSRTVSRESPGGRTSHTGASTSTQTPLVYS